MTKIKTLCLLFSSKFTSLIISLVLCLLPPFVFSSERTAFVAIIIDDIGDSMIRGEHALHIPGALTLSILPHTPYAKKLATAAYAAGKEVMLHMPMQPEGNNNMGPGGLTQTMSRQRLVQAVQQNLQSIPHIAGINNHMGSLLTQKSQQMHWIMQTIQTSGDYYFVDSVTHRNSIAQKIAAKQFIPNTRRDVFLDHEINLFAIDGQFMSLIEKATQNGFALAIGHPHNETLLALEYWIPEMRKAGIELVPVSKYISLKQQRSHVWQASLSHSRKAVKN